MKEETKTRARFQTDNAPKMPPPIPAVFDKEDYYESAEYFNSQAFLDDARDDYFFVNSMY